MTALILRFVRPITLLLLLRYNVQEGTSYSVDKYPHARDVYAFGVLIESLLELLTSLGYEASVFSTSCALLRQRVLLRKCC